MNKKCETKNFLGLLGMCKGMRILAMVAAALLLFTGISAAEPPVEEWSKTYGEHSQAYSVVQTSDRDYAFAGYNNSNGTPEFWLVKTDPFGNERWNKTFEEPTRNIDEAYSVQQTSDGGYIMAGRANNTARLVKTDSSGNEEWNKSYNGSRPSSTAYSVLQTHDGGYIFAGIIDANYNPYYVTFDAWVVKTDPLGNEQWSKKFPAGLGYIQKFRSVRQIDGGYILTGSSYPSQKAWLVKINSTGAMKWEAKFSYNQYDEAYDVRQTSDGGYIIVGTSSQFPTEVHSDALLIKTNSSGGEQWHKMYGAGSVGEDAYSFWPIDGGYIIAGGKVNTSNSNKRDGWLVETDAAGNEYWNKTYGVNSIANSIQQTSDKGYIVAGMQNGFGWLLKLSYVNVTFLPPLEDETQYNATVGSKIPITFTARNVSTGAFVYDSTASVNITNIDGITLVKFNLTNGLSVNYGAEKYEAEFNASDYSAFVNGEVYNVRAALENPGGPTGLTAAKFKIGELPTTRYINGTVIDNVTKTGISGVNVSVNTSNSTLTNATGFYSLAVGSGNYELRAKLDPMYYTNNTVTVSTVGRAVKLQDIELVKKPAGNITGSVSAI